MANGGYFPGIRDLSDNAARAVIQTLIDLGHIQNMTVEEVLASDYPVFGRLRCAMPDFSTGSICKWPMTNVTFAQQIGTLIGLTAAQIDQAQRESFARWNAVCGINLQPGSPETANILSKSGHIDGRSGTLAYSFLPCNASSTTQLGQLFDNGEAWTYPWFSEVIDHENGHGIGLEHSTDPNALMYPYSHGGQISGPQADDIRQVVLRYGPPVTQPPPTEPPAGTFIEAVGNVISIKTSDGKVTIWTGDMAQQ